MTFALLGRRALAPAGGVATVASMSIAFSGERYAVQFSPRIARRAGGAAARNLFYRQRYNFSSKQPPQLPKPTAAAAADASTPPKAATTKSSGSFVDWYEGHLESRPVVTKMFTGCILWGLGDGVAQLVPQLAGSEETKEEMNPFAYDFSRTGRAVLFGFVLHAPTSHLHFNFLEWLTQRVGVSGFGIPVFKTVMEQFVYWGWISNGMYLSAMGAMQGHSPEKIYNKIHDSIWGLMQAQWAFWIPVQLLNFQFVPVRHQLNVVLVTSIVWTALLSFWYPPEPKTAAVTLDGEAAVGTDDK